MVKNHLTQNPLPHHHSKAESLCQNILQLKKLTIKSTKDKQRKDNHILSSVEADLLGLTKKNNRGFMHLEDKAHLIDLENKRENILKEKEETWRLNSWAIWLKAGDDNTNHFQSSSKGRKAANTIWKLLIPEGISALHFPRFVDQDTIEEIISPASLEKLEGTLKWFQKDKSPQPDVWPIKFYLAFFHIIGHDLLTIVEECRLSGRMYEAINTTFIVLIPKSDTLNSYNDFRPISLCNNLYKIIAKIVANWLHPILSHHITAEQFFFLHKRQIHEAIGTTQEAIHSLESIDLKAIILKIDLAKAFDCVSWLFIKMILIHFGIPH
eukprot:PITA_26129